MTAKVGSDIADILLINRETLYIDPILVFNGIIFAVYVFSDPAQIGDVSEAIFMP